MPCPPEEEHRREASAPVPPGPDHGLDERAAIVATGDVERHLTLVEGHLAESRARVDERHPETARLLEQRPELGSAVGEVERLLVGVAVVAGRASRARLLRGAQLAEDG